MDRGRSHKTLEIYRNDLFYISVGEDLQHPSPSVNKIKLKLAAP